MWGSQGWNQWALQPSMFNDVPHEKIDWAELAKQWIQMQQNQPSDAVPPPPPQTTPPVNLPPPTGHTQLMPEEFADHNVNTPLLKTPVAPGLVPEPFHTERPFEPESGAYIPKGGDVNFWNKPQWESSTDVDDRLWNPPPVEPVAPLLGGKETFDYGHMHDNPPLAMQTIDYNHMSDYSYNQVYPPPPVPVPPPPPAVSESHYDQYWSQVNAAPTIAPIFLKKDRTTSNVQVEEETTHIDAAKRKQLPAWIRDGLEKMEQERLKRLEKERAAKEQAEQLSKTELLRKQLNLKPSAITILPKSKFDSDSDAEQAEEVTPKCNSPILRKVSAPIEDTRTEEEKKQELMLKVRRTLTEVLLSVTNSEMIAIAQEVYRKAKSRAPARQLASSTSMSSVASGLRGLASYDTESEASEADEGRKDVSDSEEELYRKIKEKKKLFAVKEKKIIADLERKELEDKTDKEKMNNGASEKKIDESVHSEQTGDMQREQSSIEKPSASVPFQKFVSSNEIPFLSERTESEPDFVSNDKESNDAHTIPTSKQIESISSEDSSSSSDSDSSERNKKKLHRDKSEKGKKTIKLESPLKHSQHRKHNRNRDSDSSEKHRRVRSPDKSERKSSKKRKKNKRSDSSSSSSSTSHRKKYSSKHSSSSYRERRSHSHDDRRHRVSVSPSRSHHRRDGHSHRSSHAHRYNDKYDKKSKEEKRYRDSKHSPSPYSHSSKLPKKYRSRSLSSDYESSGKKSKKSRNR